MDDTNRLLRMRRRLLGAVPAFSALSLGFSGVRAWASAATSSAENLPVQQGRSKLVLAGPPASVSNPLVHMVESRAMADAADQVEFVPWTNPDQLRMLVMGGDVDFIAVPTNVGANLYNRGLPLTLINVAVWGQLWMVSRQADLRTLADFKGQEIAVPFRADMPDILFRFLIEEQGLDPRRDFRLRYTPAPMDAVQLLVMHQVDHALLAEPAISMALRKTQSFPLSVVAPQLHRSVNLQEEWGRVLNRESRIPQAGMAAVGDARLDQGLVSRFEQAYDASNTWCAENPEECGEMVARHISMLSPEAISDAVRATPLYYATAYQARAELEYFYQLLLDREPAVVGGKMPTADFYGGTPA